jgi:hypothetical protein
MTEPSDVSTSSSDITRLLIKAVKGLPQEEQRVVFEFFFERGIGIPQSPFFGPFVRENAELRGTTERGSGPDPTALATMFTSRKPMGREQTMIPVRLSEAQHRRLKQWCAEHNFPMAVVVRGLIDRFLDSWEKRAA